MPHSAIIYFKEAYMPQKYKEDKMGATKEKGITLIALVITIIVLLILAGIINK